MSKKTIEKISSAAQAGMMSMQRRWDALNLSKEFEAQVEAIISKRFIDEFESKEWKNQLNQWLKDF